MRVYTLLPALLLALPLAAQQSPSPLDAGRPASRSHCAHTQYGVGGMGSRCVVGLRASLRDDGSRRVNGVDLSVLNTNPFAGDSGAIRSVVRGATLSLVGADAVELSGVNVGLVYTYGAQVLRGINVAGLAAGSDSGTIEGITVAGLFILGKRLTGLNVGGVAVLGERVRGVNASGLVVYGRRVAGVSAAGWGIQAGAGGLTGIHAGLLGAGAEGPVHGIAAGGVGVFSKSDITGIAGALGLVDARELNGVAVSAHNRVRGTQRGLAVGLVNRARHLRGVQIGLLNEVRDNPRLLRWLPIVNVGA